MTGLSLATVPGASAAGGTISGIVTDSAGTPISGATLALMDMQGQTFLPGVSSDTTGRYTFIGVGPSTWRVVAQAPGFAGRFGNAATVDAAATITITAEETVDFPVVLPRKTAAISGRVTNPSGAPVAGVAVNLFAQQNPPFLGPGSDFNGYSGNAVTDADGRYRIADLAPTPFRVSFFPSEASTTGPPPPSPYLEEFYPNAFTLADAVPVQLNEDAETSGIDAQLDLGATISGTVTDPAGNPVAGAGVYTPAAMFSGATTDAFGQYTIIGVPPGTAQVAADGPSPSPWLTGFFGGTDWATATQIPVSLGQTITGIDIQLQGAGTVDVTVIRADGSLATPRMTACLDPAMPVLGPVTFPGFAPSVGCTSGGAAVVFGNGRLPAGTYNALGDEGGGVFGNSAVELSGVASFVLPVDGAIDCVFILGGTGTCGPADPATRDGDGVAAAIEDRAPSGGDGNADGIRDATQSNVVSTPAAVGGGYATVAVPSGLQIESLSIQPTSYLVNLPIVTGAITVSVKGLPVGGTAEITVIDSNGGTATEVRALSQMNFAAVAVPAELNGTAFTASITDGGVFDQSITGPNSPPDGAVFVTLIPVITGQTSVGPIVTCQSPAPTFGVGQFGASVSASVTNNGGGVAGPAFLSQFVDTSSSGSFSVQFTASDLQGNSTTVSCSYTVMDDGDGVPYADESFDVNGDTVVDGLQAYVAPAVGTFGESSVYFVSPQGTQLSALRLEPASTVIPPSGLNLRSGLASATISFVQPGASISVDLIRFFGEGDQVWQYSAGAWLRIPASGVSGRLTVSLSDGGLGDTDGTANGTIVFNGAVLSGDTTPPTISCDGYPTFNQRQANATVTATAADFESGLTGSASLSAVADTSVGGFGSVTFTASDNAGNVGSTTCGYFVLADTDEDGAPDSVEDNAPNSGDGNLDGTLDRLQSSVVSSYVPGLGLGVVTVTTGGPAISGFTSSDYSGTPATDAATQLRGGVHRFTVTGSSARVVAKLDAGGPTNTTLMLFNGRWQPLLRVVKDGGRGDNDGVVNGRVSLTITRALVDRTPPTITCFDPGLVLLNQPSATLYAYAFDDISGVAQSDLVVPISTSTAGARTVAVTATDAAGNTATVACPYLVGVNLDRVILPRPDVIAVAKGKSVIAVRWRATDFYGADVSDPAHFVGVNATSSACIKGDKQLAEPVRDRGLRYLGGGRWQFDWTVPATKGCYELRLDLVHAAAVVPLKVT